MNFSLYIPYNNLIIFVLFITLPLHSKKINIQKKVIFKKKNFLNFFEFFETVINDNYN